MKDLGKQTISELFEIMGLLKKMIKAPDMPKDQIPLVESQIDEVERELMHRPTSGIVSYADWILGKESPYLPGTLFKKNPF